MHVAPQMSKTMDNDPVTVDLPADVVPINFSALGESKYVKFCVRIYVSLTGWSWAQCSHCFVVVAVCLFFNGGWLLLRVHVLRGRLPSGC